MILLRTIRQSLSNLQLTAGHRPANILRRLDAAPPVLIFQMGKVGSSSLINSLASTWPGLTIHTHTITKDLEKSQRVRIVYDRVIQKGGPLFIISPVREPIGRNISAFFQNFERDTGVKYNDSRFSVEELIGIFLEEYNHDVPLVWFDKQFKPVFDIDVYSFKFPANGVQMIAHNNINLLLMRSELPDSVKESAVRDFLNMPKFALLNANVGSRKEYAKTYEQFRQLFMAPDWYVRKMYDSRFFTQFYGSTERNALIRKWQNKTRMPNKQRVGTFLRSQS